MHYRLQHENLLYYFVQLVPVVVVVVVVVVVQTITVIQPLLKMNSVWVSLDYVDVLVVALLLMVLLDMVSKLMLSVKLLLIDIGILQMLCG